MKFIDDHISDEIAMGEPMLNESYPGGPLADPCASLVDDLTDRVEVESFCWYIIIQDIWNTSFCGTYTTLKNISPPEVDKSLLIEFQWFY